MRSFILSLLFLLTLTPSLAFAQTTATSTTPITAAGAAARTKADQEIARRIAALNSLVTRIQATQAISTTLKGGIISNTQNQITSLTTLKTKIDADSNMATLKTDIQSITQSYRIFVLVLPQGRITAMADRVATITLMMEAVGNKLITRLQAVASAGGNVSAYGNSVNDLSQNIDDAQNQAQSAVALIVPLQPDNGNKTVLASNTKALTQAKNDLVVAQGDLVKARKDISVIVQALAANKFPAATTTASTSASVKLTPQS